MLPWPLLVPVTLSEFPVSSTSIVPPNDHAVEDEVTAIIGVSAEGTLESSRTFSTSEDRPHALFTSNAISLGSHVSAKIKAKIWQNKYVEFGASLASGPLNERLSLSLMQGNSIPSQPLLILEPIQSSIKVQTISQWVTAFNTFVTIYGERAPHDAPKLTKYCEVVRDTTFKSGESLFYDEQFRFLQQSAPENQPWDQIHWELWLRVMVHSHGKTSPSRTHDRRLCPFRSRIVPRGTCWTFYASKPCSGCSARR